MLWIEGVEGAGSPRKGGHHLDQLALQQRLGRHEMVDLEQTAPSHRPAQARQHIVKHPLSALNMKVDRVPLLVHELPGEGATRARGDELDQIMLRQHLQGGWRGAAGGIIGGAEDPEAGILQLAGDDPPIARLPQPDGQIVTILHEVDVPVGDIELQLDLGIGRHEAWQQGHQTVVGIDGAHADAQHSSGVALAAGDGPLGLGDLLERLLALFPIELPVMGEAHAAGGAMEEFDAEPGLETLDGAAHRGGRYPQYLSRGGKAAKFGCLAKELYGAELDGVEGTGHMFIHVNNQVQWCEFIRPCVISKLLIVGGPVAARSITAIKRKITMKNTLKAVLASLLLATSAAASAAPKGEILVLLSSETELPLQGGKSLTTGFYQNELGVPAAALLEAGYTLTPVTPRGNRPVVDKHSVDPQYFGGNPQEMVRIGAVVEGLLGAGKVLSLREVLASGPERYAGLFIPGGHAPLIDLAKDPEVGTLLRHFHDNHKPTVAICHGPIALLAAQADPAGFEQSVIAGKADGAREWIYDGYRMTIFSDKEEAVFEGSLGGDKLRYYPAKAMAQAGGSMQFVAPWQPGVVIDRELITGQNPFSDHALASAFIAALDKQQGAG